MSDDALFPPSPLERLADLERFVAGELGHRLAMVDRHGDKRDYWQGRVDEARRAAEHVSALRDALEAVTTPARSANDAVAGAYDPRSEWPP